MYRGKDMYTPKEPYIDSYLYNELFEKVDKKQENRNPNYELKRGDKIKTVPANSVDKVLALATEKQ